MPPKAQQPRNEGCEAQVAVAAVGAEVHAGQHDLAVTLGNRLLRAVDQDRLLVAPGHPPRPPDDAVGAAVIAAVLHLEKES